MIELEINEKKYNLPENFKELKFKDYCRCLKDLPKITTEEPYERFMSIKKNLSIIISRLLNESDEFALNLPITVYDKLENICLYILSNEVEQKTTQIYIDGKTYTLPELEKITLRQWINLDDAVTSEDYIVLLSNLLVELGKDYNVDVIPNLKSNIENKPTEEMLPLVNYFFGLGQRFRQISKDCTQIQENLNAQPIKNS